MQLHASCAARQGDGVLLVGASGSGKSDLLLRLLDHGFDLVADDRVDIVDLMARPPSALAGLIEVRGLGIMRMPHIDQAQLVLAVEMGRPERMPSPETRHGLPLIRLDPALASAPARISAALRCLRERTVLVAGAFA